MIRRTTAALAVLALLWSVVIWMTGGGTLTFGGLRVSSTDPVRPLIAAALLFAAYGIPGTVYLFDPTTPSANTLAPAPIRNPQPVCPLPAAAPALALKAL